MADTPGIVSVYGATAAAAACGTTGDAGTAFGAAISRRAPTPAIAAPKAWVRKDIRRSVVLSGVGRRAAEPEGPAAPDARTGNAG